MPATQTPATKTTAPYARVAVPADHVAMPSFVTCNDIGVVVSVHDTLADAEAFITRNPDQFRNRFA